MSVLLSVDADLPPIAMAHTEGDYMDSISIPIPQMNHLQGIDKSETQWVELNEFYYENETVIERAAGLDLSDTAKEGGWTKLDRALDTFTETAKVISEGLIALSNIHPAIGVAVFAFHTVINLEVSRRETGRKIIAVQIQMQNMMCSLFRLRELRHADPDGDLKKHLEALMKVVADDVKICGSDLSYYVEKGFLAKMIKAKVYERRFAEHIDNFKERRAEIEMLLVSYVAGGVDIANEKLDDIGKKLDHATGKIDAVMERLFRALDSPMEEGTLRFIDQNGGAEMCISQESLLRKLLAQTGITISGKSTKDSYGQEEFLKIRESLIGELRLDLTVAFEKNLSRFEAQLQVQINNLQLVHEQLRGQAIVFSDNSNKLDQLLLTSQSILEDNRLIKKAVHPTGKAAIRDPFLQAIWDRMGLKANVKAKTFVLGLRDHLLSDFISNPTSPFLPSKYDLPELPPPATAGTLVPPPLTARGAVHFPTTSFGINADEEWVLKYLDVLHVQPIVEAMDEDGSGFISVKEANKFALSRPKDCSLPKWLGYWAAGWHINITNYRTQIYDIVQEMYRLLPKSLFINRSHVYYYFSGWAMLRIEMLLRSTKPVASDTTFDPSLLDLAALISRSQEESIMSNLKVLNFVLNSPQDARLVIGPGRRVEQAIYPLLYCLLKRHLAIIKLSATKNLDKGEVATHLTSLENIIFVVDDRITTLRATFSQAQRDLDRQFEIFSYGMFSASHLEKDLEVAKYEKLSMITFVATDRIQSQSETNTESETSDSTNSSILSKPLATHEIDESDPIAPGYPMPDIIDDIGHGKNDWIKGVWTVSLLTKFNAEESIAALFEIVIDKVDDEGQFEGRGESWRGIFNVIGWITSTRQLDDENSELDGGGVADNGYEGGVAASENAAVDASDSDTKEVEAQSSDGHVEDDDENVAGGEVIHVNQSDGDEIEEPKEPGDAGSNDSKTEDDVYSVELRLTPVNVSQVWGFSCVGPYNPTRDSIVGTCSWIEGKEGDEVDESDNLHDSSSADDKYKDESKGNGGQSKRKIAWHHWTDAELKGPFRMARTPAFALRYRYLLNPAEGPPATSTALAVANTYQKLPSEEPSDVLSQSTRLWNFAREAVLYWVRNRLGSSKIWHETSVERRQYFTCRFLQAWDSGSASDSTPQAGPKHRQLIDVVLRGNVPPSNARLYEGMTALYLKRGDGYLGDQWCDVCTARIHYGIRHLCITCIPSNMDNQVDLCVKCVDEEFTKPDSEHVNHTKAHSLLRLRDYMHTQQRYTLLRTARERSTAIKAVFRSLNAKDDVGAGTLSAPGDPGPRQGADKVNVNPYYCACCRERVELPCWVCVICDQDTIICMECDVQHKPSATWMMHSFKHILMRVSSSEAVESRKPNPATEIGKLDRRLEEAEARLNQSMGNQMKQMGQQFHQKVEVLEEKIKGLELSVGQVQGTVGKVLELLQKMSESGNQA